MSSRANNSINSLKNGKILQSLDRKCVTLTFTVLLFSPTLKEIQMFTTRLTKQQVDAILNFIIIHFVKEKKEEKKVSSFFTVPTEE